MVWSLCYRTGSDFFTLCCIAYFEEKEIFTERKDYHNNVNMIYSSINENHFHYPTTPFSQYISKKYLLTTNGPAIMLMYFIGINNFKPYMVCLFQEDMEDVRLISRGLYRVVGEELGTEKIVDMRRRVMALGQSLVTARYTDDDQFEDKLLSGSMCEGFRFASSDRDWMFIRRDIRVIFSSPTEGQYHDGQTLLMAECNTTKPGFVLLRLLNYSSNLDVTQSCVSYGDGHYVASQKWRDNAAATVSFLTPHGPCGTTVAGTTEVDFAECIKSNKLPKDAHCFVQRLHRAGWPSTSTLQKIVSGGCHFVAIGAKDSPTELIEWRISFSATEKVLIHSMNHVQFLCYGILKIFLKEAIDVNTEIKGLLCSYFLKTALFWEISTGHVQWNASNFLSSFWTCFQRLLHWINNEYCPNFFIPENNMFSGKVHGEARKRLLFYLVPLYKQGYSCLLQSPSLQHELNAIIQRPLLVNTIETTEESEKCQIEVKLILELWNSKPYFKSVQSEIIKQLQDLDNVISINNSEFEQDILWLWRNYLLQNLSMSTSTGCSITINETADRSRQSNIPVMPVVDATRHLLYTALYHYRRGMYSAALCQLQEAKTKLQHPHLLYPHYCDVKKYRAAGGEHKPFTQMMKEIVAWAVELETGLAIPELTLEHQAADNYTDDLIFIPPLVFTNFMYFLCYHHMGIFHEAQSMLQELSILVQYDNEYHIPKSFEAISWQIMGICREISGDHKDAYQSYCNALQQKWCKIKSASLMRISVIVHKYMTGRC